MNPVKYIVINGEIRMSHVQYHRFLLKKRERTCDGGGIVELDNINKLIIFSGKSDDFGKVDKDYLQKIIENNREKIDNNLYFLFNKEITKNYNVVIN